MTYRDPEIAAAIAAMREEAGHQDGPPETNTVIENLSHSDFFAYMLEHKYIFVRTGEIWPAQSVNARLPKIDDVKASAWLDKHRPVEQMTWAPGFPQVISDKLVSEGGWFESKGCSVFNQYKPPSVLPVVGNVERWLCHVELLYGAEQAAHIVKWCAHRVQRPYEKINHALVLGGKQGIGKDSLLEPVKHAIGAWNFVEVSPKDVLATFNGHVQSVVLRISEARDLGDFDRFSFYDHTKAITAAPPNVLRVNQKYRLPYAIPNVCGVIITTNHKSDGIFLPADDRRHFVAWSDCDKGDFTPAYWTELWEWYDRCGLDAVAHYLMNLDLAGFNAKEPPPKTNAFFEIVNASRSPDDAELADALDKIEWPDAVTTAQIIAATTNSEFAEYLGDRKNSRRIPYRFEACGYTPVRNPDSDDGLWKIKGRRQVVYAKAKLTQAMRLSHARKL